MYTKDDVAKLLGELAGLELDPPLEVGEPQVFGLEVELFEPVTGQVITLCRPQRRDIGETEIKLSADQVGSLVAGMRAHALMAQRHSGEWKEPSEEARGDARARWEETVRRKNEGLRPAI